MGRTHQSALPRPPLGEFGTLRIPANDWAVRESNKFWVGYDMQTFMGWNGLYFAPCDPPPPPTPPPAGVAGTIGGAVAACVYGVFLLGFVGMLLIYLWWLIIPVAVIAGIVAGVKGLGRALTLKADR